MKYHNLPTTPAYGVFMLCRECGNHYSATKGDYFTRNPDHHMMCCDQKCELVREKTAYLPVEDGEGEQ